MPIIDDEGRILGVVNVIDALVVLLLLSVVVAGVALVTQGGGSENQQPTTEHRYVTLDFGSQPAYVISALESPARSTPSGDAVQLSDVYAVPTGPEQYHLYARANLTVMPADEGVSFRSKPLKLGRSLSVSTPETSLGGTVVDIGTNGASLPRTNTDLVVSTSVSRARAARIQDGQSLTVLGDQLATVESVTVYPTNDPTVRRVLVGLSVESLSLPGGPTYADSRLEQANGLHLWMGQWNAKGSVLAVGRTEPPGTMEHLTANLTITGAEPSVVSAIRPGLTETIRGRTLARVTDVSVEPTQLVVTSDSGDVFLRDHPKKKDVHLTVELAVRRTGSQRRFHGTELRRNDVVQLDLGTIRVSGRVEALTGPT